MTFRDVPKVDLHVHLEGTISPEMVQRLAKRNNIPVPEGLITDGRFNWRGEGDAASELKAFLHAYDVATSVMRNADDYADVTYDYLKRSADEGCIYAEITISADHGVMVGLTYPEMLAAIERGYQKAKAETGIEARLLPTCVRHYGPEGALKMARITKAHPHPLVTGMGIAGDENAHSFADFKEAFELSGLPHRTAHAGEAAGPESVIAARDTLKVRRFGHMVRAIEDMQLMQQLKVLNAVPEVCVSSNICMRVFPDYQSHPLRKFFDMGIKVTLGSDDPTFFGTSIGREYQIAQEEFGFSDNELRQISLNAVEEAFVDEKTRAELLRRVG